MPDMTDASLHTLLARALLSHQAPWVLRHPATNTDLFRTRLISLSSGLAHVVVPSLLVIRRADMGEANRVVAC